MDPNHRAPPNLLWKANKVGPASLLELTEPQAYENENTKNKLDEVKIRKMQASIEEVRELSKDLQKKYDLNRQALEISFKESPIMSLKIPEETSPNTMGPS